MGLFDLVRSAGALFGHAGPRAGKAMPATPARPPGGPVSAGMQGTARLYTVRSGDTLPAIAERLYGDPGDSRRILEANQPMLGNDGQLAAGQVLCIP